MLLSDFASPKQNNHQDLLILCKNEMDIIFYPDIK
jgi:hypothetical protein